MPTPINHSSSSSSSNHNTPSITTTPTPNPAASTSASATSLNPEQVTPADPPFRTISYLPTEAAYDRWADVYDTDGNFLQALDTRELGRGGLLKRFLGIAGIAGGFTSSRADADDVAAASAMELSGKGRGGVWGVGRGRGEVRGEGKCVVDLGCGTGRVTFLVFGLIEELTRDGGVDGMARVRVTGLDSSEGMLAVARRKRAEIGRSSGLEKGEESNGRDMNEQTKLRGPSPYLTFLRADIDDIASLNGAQGPVKSATSGNNAVTESDISIDASTNDTSTAAASITSSSAAAAAMSQLEHTADAIISALVLEHINLHTFFRAAVKLLKPAPASLSSPDQPPTTAACPHLLLTNMHSEMGRISQAGFVDASTGEKVRPRSYAHSVEEVKADAARWGFTVCEEWQREVRPEDVEGLGPRSAKWVGVRCWFALVLRLEKRV